VCISKILHIHISPIFFFFFATGSFDKQTFRVYKPGLETRQAQGNPLLQTILTVPGIYMASNLMRISFFCEGKLAGTLSQPLSSF
jgi:hypothetical protein